MPLPGPFGPFEVSRELDTSTGATVYRARKEGQTKDEFVVKVFSLERQVTEAGQEPVPELETLFHDLGASFTTRIQLQKAAADSSPYFAPILAGGHDERGPWYVTNFYARSLKGMLEHLTALDAADVFHIAYSLVQAALHLKRTAGRPHGNLKPSNIFVEGLARLRDSRVRVTDPLAGEARDAPAYELADLRAIGEVIYQLALKRKVDFTWVMVPLEAAPEWKRLFGEQSGAWLDLCNRLLDPRLSLASMSLERVAGDLEKLRPKRSLVPVLAAAGAALLLLSAGAWLFFKPSNTASLVVDSDPPGTHIELWQSDGDKVTPEPGSTARRMRIKVPSPDSVSYTVRATYGDLAADKQDVRLKNGKTTSLKIKLAYSKLVVRSTPPGALFFKRNDGTAFTTPHTFDVFKPGATNIEFTLKDYRASFTNFTVGSGGSQQVEIVLQRLKAGQKNIEFSSEPSGVEITVSAADGQQVGRLRTGAGTKATLTLTAGDYNVTSRLEGWPEATTNLSVQVQTGQSTDEKFSVYFRHGTLALGTDLPVEFTLTFTASGISFTKAKVSAPMSFPLPEGPVQIRLDAPGFKPFTTNLVIADRVLQQFAPALEPVDGSVAVVTDPPGASIYEGTKLLTSGAVGTVTLPLPRGTHQLRASLPGLEDARSESFSVSPGKLTQIRPLVFNYAQLTFTAAQPGELPPKTAVRKTSAPPAELALGQGFVQPTGRQTYQLKLEGYEVWERELTLSNHEVRIETVRLEKTKYPVSVKSDPPSGVRYVYQDKGGRSANWPADGRLPWGDYTVVASCANLPAQTQPLTIPKTGSGAGLTFAFGNYGTLITSNLTGVKEVALASQTNWTWQPPENIYVKPGSVELLLRYPNAIDTLTTNAPSRSDPPVVLVATGLPPFTNQYGMVFLWVKGLPDAAGNASGGYVGKYEVTQSQYEGLMKTNPSETNRMARADTHKPLYPVNKLEPADAAAFCELLTRNEKEPRLRGWTYTLPTTTQWLFFAVGTGTNGAALNYEGVAKPPREISDLTENANQSRLCDVLGNFAELCSPGNGTQGYASLGGDYTTEFYPDNNGPPTVERNLLQPKPFKRSSKIGFRVVVLPPARVVGAGNGSEPASAAAR